MPEKWVLQQLQGLPLAAKIAKTQLRIREWYNYFDGDVYVSFSGGKDSTVLAHLVHDIYPDVPLVFSNTGLEYPEIQSFARKMGAEFLRPKMMFSEVISKYGYPIISKEVAEAIYYARRIRDGWGGYGTTEKYRNDFHGLRVYAQQAQERIDGRERANCKVHSIDRKRAQFAVEYGRITRGVAQEDPTPG